jgi:hypothetical protein
MDPASPSIKQQQNSSNTSKKAVNFYKTKRRHIPQFTGLQSEGAGSGAQTAGSGVYH